MNVGALQLAETADLAAWDAWVEQSPQGTVFCKSTFLQSLNARFRLFTVVANTQVIALLPLLEDDAGQVVRYPFTPYQGILFLPRASNSPHRRVVDEFRITEFLIGELTTRYQRIDLALSWQFADLRAFLWHNHGVADAPHFVAQPRYTALLDLRSLDASSYPQAVRACRRQELRKAASLQVSEHTDLDAFSVLYASTFSRQGIEVDAQRLQLVRSIATSAIRYGYGRLSACTSEDGVGAMNLFVYDRKRAYYLFAANDPALRNTGASTRLMFDSILEAKQRGLDELDFVGVNSPARGDFKLSFNARLQLYFELGYAANGTRAP